jgi:hypothetical protein
MPTTTIKDFQSWSPTQLKAGGYQKDNFGFATESDTWVNWVFLVALLLVLTLEVVLSKQVPSSVKRSLGAMYPTTSATIEKARHTSGAFYGLNFKP